MFLKPDYVEYLAYDSLEVEDLSERHISILKVLNEKLTTIEKNLIRDCSTLNKQAYNRCLDRNDWIHDYEIWCDITFKLREDDPGYIEDAKNDNTLVILSEYPPKPTHSEHAWDVDDGENHNEFQYWKKHPMHNEHHCWLYYCLYDHTDLGWANIIRIGDIWVDITVQYQNFWRFSLNEI